MRCAWLLLPLVVACAKKTEVTTTELVSPWPELHCPEGTIPAGSAPPRGFEVWCTHQLPNGQPEREGPSFSFHPNVQEASIGSYIAGKKSGEWQYYYANGQVERVGSYVNGEEEGEWTSFHANGQKASTGLYTGGKEQGPWLYWSEDGKTRTEGQWKVGARDGVWRDFDAIGNAIREKSWRDGRMTGQRELAPVGEPVTPAPAPAPAPAPQ